MLSHMFEMSVLMLSCWFLFSLECIGMCLGNRTTDPCTKGYGGWRGIGMEGGTEGKVP